MINTGRDGKEHLEHLEEVLKRLQKHSLPANCEKCEFFQTKITYCWYVVDQHGLYKVQEKVDAVVNTPRLVNFQQLRTLLGLVNSTTSSCQTLPPLSIHLMDY